MSVPVAIDQIRRDGGTQMRASLNEDAVGAYAERMEAGDEFPPIDVFYDGGTYWLGDGFHRVAAQLRLANQHIGSAQYARWMIAPANVHAGRREDAIRFAISANKKNGLRRTNADKQIAVRAALAHPDMQGMSDQAIADEAGVSRVMVFNARQVVTVTTSSQPQDSKSKSAPVSRTGVDGKKYRKPSPAPKVGRPSTKTENERRVAGRERAAKSRAVAKGGDGTRVHKCPLCNGKAFISDELYQQYEQQRAQRSLPDNDGHAGDGESVVREERE